MFYWEKSMVVSEKSLPAADANEDRIEVLIIDDSPSDREYYARCLDDMSIEASLAPSGAEGRKMLYEYPYDCVLLDYNMPRHDGIDVLQALTRDTSTHAPPVIMLTGAGSEDVAVSAWQSGAADYLCKDKVTLESLHRAVTNAVEKSRLKRTIAEHAAKLEKANSELRKRNEEIKRFYQTISHELNTPLAAARECVSVVCDGVAGTLNPEQKEFLEDAIDSHDQMAGHIQDLMESTRLDNGKIKVVRRPFCLEDAIRRTMAANAQLARDYSVDIHSSVPEDLPRVNADRNRIIQVLCNLLSNAIKHSQASHAVYINVERTGDRVRIEVVDKGCGIDEIHQTGIFERLFQVPASREKGNGLGLGLSIAKEIIRLHDSEIDVQSSLGQGSVFSFELEAVTKSR